MYALADRLSAQCFLEFDWHDRSWEFAPTTFVQALPPLDGLSIDGRGSDRWIIFGATKETVDQFCADRGLIPARTFIEVDLARYRLRFVRNAILIDDPTSLFGKATCPPIVTRWALESAFTCLPSIRFAAQHWIGEEAEVEEATLRAALQSEKSDQEGQFQKRPFDGSPGLWRVDGVVRQYFWVSITPRGGKVHIVRTPYELGRWFDAFAPGSMRYHAVSGTMILEFESKSDRLAGAVREMADAVGIASSPPFRISHGR